MKKYKYTAKFISGMVDANMLLDELSIILTLSRKQITDYSHLKIGQQVPGLKKLNLIILHKKVAKGPIEHRREYVH